MAQLLSSLALVCSMLGHRQVLELIFWFSHSGGAGARNRGFPGAAGLADGGEHSGCGGGKGHCQGTGEQEPAAGKDPSGQRSRVAVLLALWFFFLEPVHFGYSHFRTVLFSLFQGQKCICFSFVLE